MIRKKWLEFENVLSQNAVHKARFVRPDELVDMAEYKQAQRISECQGIDPILICLAYAQDCLIYNDHGQHITVSKEKYESSKREEKVNIFGLSYRRDAKLYLQQTLADIVVEAAIYLQKTQSWKIILYDGLRTVEGAFLLYNFATDSDLSAGLLALPGKSAHNKALAIDSMMIDENNCEVEMGGHFDHTDMSTNSRFYQGDKISPLAKKNRLLREAAFLRAAFAKGLLIAPLRNEFWDDRLPENRADLWRIIDSAARVIGIEFKYSKECENWNYADFLDNWRIIFRNHEKELIEKIGVLSPPMEEKFEFYHGNYHPIYDRDLRKSGKHLTN